ncbi:trehalase family glycosidase [Cognatishimia sp. WU-CL00825]|uniref:MGH1-like glycoside hydrolase domain-containing protein n=1 Tax=Cognatishimia sp. WU-CL00825 TaxID=3127658 RepID=UPI0031063FBC
MNAQTNHNREARNILVQNDRGGYTVPTEGLYPYQWNWDSAIAALGFATFDLKRAWQELETLFSGQWDDGMVPHIIFHKPDPSYFPGLDVWQGTGPVASTGITQPPVAATMARLIFEQDKAAGKDMITALFPKMLAWHRWFLKWRVDANNAICVTHPWESGRDNAPEWDAILTTMKAEGVGEYTRRDTGHVDASMRPTKFDYDRYIWLVQQGAALKWDQQKLLEQNPFRMADPTTTFLLLRAHKDLLSMGTELGLDISGIEAEIETLTAGAESLWNQALGSYDARNGHTGDFAGCMSNASFLCWFAGLENADQLAKLQTGFANTNFPVASHPTTSQHYDSCRYWRGPTWAFMNMLIGIGLADQGHADLAERLRLATADLIRSQGFAEYYDSTTGAAAGGQSFTWTAATWLAWANPNERRD